MMKLPLFLIIAAVCLVNVLGKHYHDLLDAHDYKVTGLKKFGIEDDTYAGLMPITWSDDTEGSFFFWLAKQRKEKSSSKSSDKKDKLVVWLNGGPGCSSMVGMFWENGPFHIKEGDKKKGLKYDLEKNPYSWNEIANVLYVEQPIRTGFAAAAVGADVIRNERQIARDFRNFLLSFMAVFPEFKGMEIILTGESYAGAYIPWIAEHIVEEQLLPVLDTSIIDDFYYSVSEEVEDQHMRDIDQDGINLVGVAIGNGVIDYFHQEPSYAEYAYYHGLIPLGAKQKIDFDFQMCLKQIQDDGVPPTRGSFDRCHTMAKVLEAAGLPNEYNTATFQPYSIVLDPDSPFQKFFQDPEIQEMLHVRGYNIPGMIFTPELPDNATTIEQDDDFLPHGAAASHHHNVHHHHHHDHEDDDRGGKHFHHDYNDDTDDHGDDTDDYDDDDDDTYKGFYYKPPSGWHVCNDKLNDQMRADHPITIVPTLQFLTDAPPVVKNKGKDKERMLSGAKHSSLRVLLYSGEFDLNCNTLGTLHTLEANSWMGRPWNQAARSLWVVDDDVAGEYFTMDEVFSFLIVRNSGHLLPMDLPKIGLELLDRFLHEESFADRKLPSEADYLQQLKDMQDAQADADAKEKSSGFADGRGVSLLITLFLVTLAIILTLYVIHHVRPKLLRGEYVAMAGDPCASKTLPLSVHHTFDPNIGSETNVAYQQQLQYKNGDNMEQMATASSLTDKYNQSGIELGTLSQTFTDTISPSVLVQQSQSHGRPRRSDYQQL